LISIENAIGGSGADILIGNTENNTLIGGAGADVLTGQGGADIFAFLITENFTTSTSDRITDFSNDDKILISRAAFGITESATSLTISTSSTSTSKALATNSLFVYDSSTGNLFFNQNRDASGFGLGGLLAIFDNKFGLLSSNISLAI